MPATFNSIGTAYIASGPLDEDLWRPATVWFVAFGMPLLPLRRHVIRPGHTEHDLLNSSTAYEIADSTAPRAAEVFATLGRYWLVHFPIAVGPLALCILLLYFFHESEQARDVLLGGTVVGLIWLVIYAFRQAERAERALGIE